MNKYHIISYHRPVYGQDVRIIWTRHVSHATKHLYIVVIIVR